MNLCTIDSEQALHINPFLKVSLNLVEEERRRMRELRPHNVVFISDVKQRKCQAAELKKHRIMRQECRSKRAGTVPQANQCVCVCVVVGLQDSHEAHNGIIPSVCTL